jgi:hypothetical protein
MSFITDIQDIMQVTAQQLDELNDKERENNYNKDISEQKRREVQSQINAERLALRMGAKSSIYDIHDKKTEEIKQAYVVNPDQMNEDYKLLKSGSELDAASLEAMYSHNQTNPLVLQEIAKYNTEKNVKAKCPYYNVETATNEFTGWVNSNCSAINNGSIQLAMHLSGRTTPAAVTFASNIIGG